MIVHNRKTDFYLGNITAGSPFKLGSTHTDDGVNFAVFSDHAEMIEVCLFSDTNDQEICKLALPEKTGSIFHGYLPGLKPGAKYGLRAHGPYLPEQGHRFNPNKLLLDPYARALSGTFTNNEALLGYDDSSEDLDLVLDTRDSAAFLPKCVVVSEQPAERNNNSKTRVYSDELVYEAHVKGLTRLHPGVDETIRGTYDALAADAVIEHLQALGVTTVELMPIHTFVDDTFLTQRGLTNYWGYNSIGFFSPEARYCGPSGIGGLRSAIAKLKNAGISVILDVVYNHTAEGDQNGPTLSFRGLDNHSYYRLQENSPRYYVNDTGCGNTLDCSHHFVNRLIMDSLRYWVEHYGIDGFRFDLASTLARTKEGFTTNSSFFTTLVQDPVLSKTRLIAEPWDIGPGGYQLGNFPPVFSELNDQYRDSVRKFWKGEEHSAQALAGKLLGSADIFDNQGRRSWSSINFVSSHDGFTLSDLAKYNERHNEANTENNNDGHGANYSDNCGFEGDSDDPEINSKRSRRLKNILATLFVSQGVPMLLAGDEIGNSQQGNNNAYCQDNSIGWIEWNQIDDQLLEFVKALSATRKQNRAIRQSKFLHGSQKALNNLPDVEWMDLLGQPVCWDDGHLGSFALLLRKKPSWEQDCDKTVVLAFNRSNEVYDFPLTTIDNDSKWTVEIDTSCENQKPHLLKDNTYHIKEDSVVIWTLSGK